MSPFTSRRKARKYQRDYKRKRRAAVQPASNPPVQPAMSNPFVQPAVQPGTGPDFGVTRADLDAMTERDRKVTERLLSPGYDAVESGDCVRCGVGPRLRGGLCLDCDPDQPAPSDEGCTEPATVVQPGRLPTTTAVAFPPDLDPEKGSVEGGRRAFTIEEIEAMTPEERRLAEALSAPGYDAVAAGDCERCGVGPRVRDGLCLNCAPEEGP